MQRTSLSVLVYLFLRSFRAFVYPRLVTLDLWTWVEAICGWAKMVWQSADPGLGAASWTGLRVLRLLSVPMQLR